MSGTLSPTPKFTGFDNDGAIVSGGKLFTYTAGTTTKVNTYADVGLNAPNPNPTVLDSAGRATIFLTPGTSYKFVLSPSTDTDPPTDPIWTQDNIEAVPLVSGATDILGTAGETLAAGQCIYLSDGTPGGTVAGEWYKALATVANTSSSSLYIGFANAAISSGDVGSIRIGGQITGLSGLNPGDAYYISDSIAGTITNTPPAAPAVDCKVLVSDSTTTGILIRDPQYLLQAVDIQSFVASGSWIAPNNGSNLQSVRVICYGAGGGGGGGQGGISAGNASDGGTGGGGGARTERIFQYTEITTPVTVTVGAAGTAGSGGDGGIGGNTTFGSYLIAYGGGGGKKGAAATAYSGGTGGGSASAGVVGSTGTVLGGLPTAQAATPSSEQSGGGSSDASVGYPAINGGGGGGSDSSTGGVGLAGGTSMRGGGGGGAAGGVTSGNSASAGAAGGNVSLAGALTSGGGGTGGSASTVFNTNQNGAAGSLTQGGQGGGGGGGRRDGTASAAGGSGGSPGGGGGGGGAGQNGSAAGDGGTGGSGACYVITTIRLVNQT